MMKCLPSPDLSIIAAIGQNNIIGNSGKLPWNFSEDLQYFKKITTEHSIIMGRNTYESIGKPLSNRRNIIVSKTISFIDNCEIYKDLNFAIQRAKATDLNPFIIGGAEIYKQTLSLATYLYITEVNIETTGNIFFPQINYNEWEEIENKLGNDKRLTFKVYKRLCNI